MSMSSSNGRAYILVFTRTPYLTREEEKKEGNFLRFLEEKETKMKILAQTVKIKRDKDHRKKERKIY